MTDDLVTDARPTLVSIRSLSKRFGETLAVDDVSLDIRRNEFFALLGPSGCGKTTLLRSLAGFEHPDTGAITMSAPGGEIDLLALPPERRPVNLMFQSYALFPHMSVEKNVAYGLQREGLPLQDVWLDPAARLGPAVGSRGLPTTLFFDARGRRVDAHFGLLSAASLRTRLQALKP